MKPNANIIAHLMLLFFTQINAQDSIRKNYIGLDVCIVKPGAFRDAIYPSVTFSTRKHVFFIGPNVTYFSDEYPQAQLGLQLGYQLYPYGHNKIVNLFFEYNLSYVQGVFQKSYNDYYWGGSTKMTYKYTTLDNYFGFGFRLNITKYLYFKSNFGLSIGFYSKDYSYIYSTGEEYAYSGNLYPSGLSLANKILKVGFGYDLIPVKRKIAKK